MPNRSLPTLTVRDRRQWRAWLRTHHAATDSIWLVLPKRHTGQTTLSYDDAVEEALCFGWIDSLVRRLDDAHYARKFTPRSADSRWSTANRRRYADLQARGRLAAAGKARPPPTRSGDTPRPSTTALPAYLAQALAAHPRTRQHFEQLAPSYRRAYVGWIDSAKRAATREKRLREALDLLAAGRKLGLK